MGTVRIILTIAEAVACLGCFAVVIISFLRKHHAKSQCDTCVHLVRKRKKNFGTYHYSCTTLLGFDTPPEYCRDYIKRKEEGQEDGD